MEAVTSNVLHKPDIKEMLFFLLSGVIVSIPITLFINNFASFLCFQLPLFYASICLVAIFTPFIEEFAKAYPIFYRHGETERSIFNLGFLIGTGFGLAEFLLYVGFLGVPIPIRLPLVFFHSASTSITAYGVARRKTVRLYLAAVGLHFAINFISIVSSLWHVAFLFVFVTYYYSWKFYKQTSHNSSVK